MSTDHGISVKRVYLTSTTYSDRYFIPTDSKLLKIKNNITSGISQDAVSTGRPPTAWPRSPTLSTLDHPGRDRAVIRDHACTGHMVPQYTLVRIIFDESLTHSRGSVVFRV